MEKTSKKPTRELILDAVESACLKHGEAFTLEHIAQQAGVSKMTVYRNFKGKGTLIQSCIEERGLELPWVQHVDMRHRILDAMTDVIVRHGFSATVEQFAEAAGVGVATVYRQFGDKKSLLRDFREHIRPALAFSQLEWSASEDLEANLSQFAIHTLQQMAEKKDVLTVFLQERMRNDNEFTLDENSGKTMKRLVRFFQEQIDSGRLHRTDANNAAIAFFGMLTGFAWIAPTLQGLPLEHIEEKGRWIARTFLHGIQHSNGEADDPSNSK